MPGRSRSAVSSPGLVADQVGDARAVPVAEVLLVPVGVDRPASTPIASATAAPVCRARASEEVTTRAGEPPEQVGGGPTGGGRLGLAGGVERGVGPTAAVEA